MPRLPVRSARRIAAALAGVALAGGALAGCSALAPDGKVQACATLAGDLPGVTSQLQDAAKDVPADIPAAVTKLKSAKSDFDGSIAKLKNAEVKSTATKASTALGTLTTKLEAASANPVGTDLSALQTEFTQTRDQFTTLADTCSKVG